MNRLQIIREEVDRQLENMPAEKKQKAVLHLYGVSLAAGIIAEKRKQNTELSCIAAMMHDLYAYTSGSYDDHAHKGAELAEEILKKLDITTEEENAIICSAIYHHDDKGVTDSEMDEVLKDADVVHHTMADPFKPVKEKEQARYEALRKEFGIDA